MTAALTAVGTLLGILLGFASAWQLQAHLLKVQTIKVASLSDAYEQKEYECRVNMKRMVRK